MIDLGQPYTDMVEAMKNAVTRHPLRQISGRLSRVRSNSLLVAMEGLVIGETCRIVDPQSRNETLAEVIGVENNEAILAPLGPIQGMSLRAQVIPTWAPLDFPCGSAMLGGVFDGLGRPIDRIVRAPGTLLRRSIAPQTPDPYTRPLIKDRLITGLRAIDGLLTMGAGQRIGVFGAAGSGKTSFIGALARNVDCDVCVLALIGERGRELREFLDRQLPEEFIAKCVVVTATSDRPAMERVMAAHVASSVAEYFRDRGHRVLFLFDSVTRFARALREVGLAAGEQAVRRGFPPSVYSELPRLIERAGPSVAGSISAIYSVLLEDENNEDPIGEEVRSLTDGHFYLSAKLGHAGHYPALDILRSNSRLMSEIVAEEQIKSAQHIRSLMAKYEEIALLVQVGEFQQGQDALADESLAKRQIIESFLRQGPYEVSKMDETLSRLNDISGVGSHGFFGQRYD